MNVEKGNGASVYPKYTQLFFAQILEKSKMFLQLLFSISYNFYNKKKNIIFCTKVLLKKINKKKERNKSMAKQNLRIVWIVEPSIISSYKFESQNNSLNVNVVIRPINNRARRRRDDQRKAKAKG